MRCTWRNRFVHILLALAAITLLAGNIGLATNVTVTINRVYQLNGDLLDIDNLDMFNWADFYPEMWVGNELSDKWRRADLGFSDTRDVYPTNWTNTWNPGTSDVQVGIRIWDADDGYMDGEAYLRPEYPTWKVVFSLDTATGAISVPGGINFSGPLPSVVSGAPNNRKYTSSAAPDNPCGAQIWFTVQIEDTVVPEDFTLTSTPSTWAQSSTVSASGGYDVLSGFDRFEFWLNGVKKYTDYTTSASHVDAQQGGNTWVIKAYDKSGNHRDKTVNTNIDKSAPYDFSLWVDPTGYTNGGATVYYSGAGDSLSGFDHFAFYLDGSYWFTTGATSGSNGLTAAEGTHTVTAYEYDAAGNYLAKSVSIYIDTTPPSGSTPAVSPSSWTTGNVTVSFSATDALSGMDHYEVALDAGAYSNATSPYTVTTEGQHTVHVKAVDVAGNSSIWDVISRIDRTAPTGSISINGGAAYASTRDVTLDLSYSDASSGVSSMRFSNWTPSHQTWSAWEAPAAARSWTLSSWDGIKTVEVQFKDNLGNTSAYSDTIVLDTLPPVVSVGSPDPPITVAGEVWLPVSFNEDITGFGSPGDIQVNRTGTAAVGDVAITGSGRNYTVILSSITGVGTVGITVKAEAAVDPFQPAERRERTKPDVQRGIQDDDPNRASPARRNPGGHQRLLAVSDQARFCLHRGYGPRGRNARRGKNRRESAHRVRAGGRGQNERARREILGGQGPVDCE